MSFLFLVLSPSEMVSCFNEIAGDPECRVVVVSGAGKIFTAGVYQALYTLFLMIRCFVFFCDGSCWFILCAVLLSRYWPDGHGQRHTPATGRRHCQSFLEPQTHDCQVSRDILRYWEGLTWAVPLFNSTATYFLYKLFIHVVYNL